MAPHTLSKSSSAPVVRRAGFAAHYAHTERRALEAKEKSRGFQRQGATVIAKGPPKPHVKIAVADSKEQEFQRLLQSDGFRQRFSPRTQHAACFVGKLATGDKDPSQGWNLLVQHDVTKYKQAEEEKERAAAQKRLEVGLEQQRQAHKRTQSSNKALQESRQNWSTKFQHDSAQMKKEHEEILKKKEDAKQELNRQRKLQLDDARQRKLDETRRQAHEDQINAIAALERGRLREENEMKLRAEQRKDLMECSRAATRAIEERKQQMLVEQEEDRKRMAFYNARVEAEDERRRQQEEERTEKIKKRLASFDQFQGGSAVELMRKQAIEDEKRAKMHRQADDAKAEAKELEKRRAREELQKQCNESVERQLADKAAAAKRMRDEESVHAERVFRLDAKFKADESAKSQERRRKANQNAEALKEQIHKQVEDVERMSSRERALNRSRLELAKGSLEGIFQQRRQGGWPTGPIGLPG